MFTLDKQLQQDTHELFNDQEFHVLLHKNATIPWIILVPKTEVTEIYSLSSHQQYELTKWQKIISSYFRENFNSKKMNIAAIGNVVSQLHIHVIGRRNEDACWPDVVWGNQYPVSAYSQDEIEHIKQNLIINI